MPNTPPKDSPPLPFLFLERMQQLLKEDYPAFLSSYDEAPKVGLRVNTLKIAVSDFYTISPYPLKPVPWCSSGFIVSEADPLEEKIPPGKHPYHIAGLFYLQEPSAMLPPEMLNPQPNERVLDLAAAPGGKTTHIAALMQTQGLLVANEIHPKRVWELVKNLERCGVCNAMVTNETPERLAQNLEGFFDKVLVDAPCSGEGMFRKNPRARLEWKPTVVQGCAARQRVILESAARLVRPDGCLLYSTCTFSPEENEGVIARFLADHPEFEIVDIPRQEFFLPCRPDLVGPDALLELVRAIRLMPHNSPGEGHFAVLMRKKVGSQPKISPANRLARIPHPMMRSLADFCENALTDQGRDKVLVPERLALVGTYLYLLPPNSPDWRGLRVIHPGWWLGRYKRNRFEPSHALARGLTCQDTRICLDLGLEDARLEAYFHGKNIPLNSDNHSTAWMLVTLEGHPLGWGKAVAGVLKNFYPHGLRLV